MPTLNELLDINMSYDDILENLSEETDSFTLPSGEVAFDDQYEAEVAISILKNHYQKVNNDGLDILNKDTSGFVISFSDPYLDGFPTETEEESVIEQLNESYIPEDIPNTDLDRDTVYTFTNFEEFDSWVEQL